MPSMKMRTKDEDEDSELYDADVDEEQRPLYNSSVNITEEPSIANDIGACFEKRMPFFLHDFSRSARLCSPAEDIQMDVKASLTLEDRLGAENLLKKLYCSPQVSREAELMQHAQVIGTFWNEFAQFLNRTGPVYGREHIWLDPDIWNNPHLWHSKYSLGFTKIFGKFACETTSKPVGIGPAERNWADHKHVLGGNKRFKLSAKRQVAQATLMGIHCAEKAKIRKRNDNSVDNFEWTTEDYKTLRLTRYVYL